VETSVSQAVWKAPHKNIHDCDDAAERSRLKDRQPLRRPGGASEIPWMREMREIGAGCEMANAGVACSQIPLGNPAQNLLHILCDRHVSDAADSRAGCSSLAEWSLVRTSPRWCCSSAIDWPACKPEAAGERKWTISHDSKSHKNIRRTVGHPRAPTNAQAWAHVFFWSEARTSLVANTTPSPTFDLTSTSTSTMP